MTSTRFYRNLRPFHADEQSCDQCGISSGAGQCFSICLDCGKTLCTADEARHACERRAWPDPPG